MGCAGLKTYGYLECRSADILLRRDIATQLKPDVILVAGRQSTQSPADERQAPNA